MFWASPVTTVRLYTRNPLEVQHLLAHQPSGRQSGQQRGNAMQITSSPPKNKFLKHGGVCQHCGAEILPRRLRGKSVGRTRTFCSNKCRQAAFRNAEFARRYGSSGALRNGLQTIESPQVFSTILPTEASSGVWRKVLEAEQPWRTSGASIVSRDGVQCFVVGKLRRSR
jgi:hypothetical protein